MLRMRITRRGFVMLAESAEVLSIRPAGWADVRPLWVDPAADIESAAAASGGLVHVILSLRDTPADGIAVTRAERDHLAASRQRIYDDLFGALGAGAAYRDRSLETSGTGFAELSLAAYRQLLATESRRLVAVSMNRPVATISPITSGALFDAVLPAGGS